MTKRDRKGGQSDTKLPKIDAKQPDKTQSNRDGNTTTKETLLQSDCFAPLLEDRVFVQEPILSYCVLGRGCQTYPVI